MGLFSLEHSRAMVRADFGSYGVAVVLLSGLLLGWAPAGQGWLLWLLVAAGLAGWTLLEYGLHRVVLHHVPPFCHWHALHHQRPTAYIGTPTLMSALLLAAFVWAPTLWLAGPWPACALVLGVGGGYWAYGLAHHANHHGRSHTAWLAGRQRWHAQHHRAGGPGCFGVTTGLWDHVFRTAPPARAPLRC